MKRQMEKKFLASSYMYMYQARSSIYLQRIYLLEGRRDFILVEQRTTPTLLPSLFLSDNLVKPCKIVSGSFQTSWFGSFPWLHYDEGTYSVVESLKSLHHREY